MFLFENDFRASTKTIRGVRYITVSFYGGDKDIFQKVGNLMAMETAAIYCRLSQDDGSVGESGSIQTQKTLLTQYCKEHHIKIGDCCCDDGWSGTNFDRPNFKRMIDDIELGKVNIVIVKDLSRFGREYAQMGMYIEHYFEEKGVRFISVAENIDSKNGIDNLVLPFTNVINSFYARQASSKTKAAKEARAKSGTFLGSHAPFGYRKDPSDRHHLVVDSPAAEAVREIFQLFADGVGYVCISKILRSRGVLTPPPGLLQSEQSGLLQKQRLLAQALRLARHLCPRHPEQSGLSG